MPLINIAILIPIVGWIMYDEFPRENKKEIKKNIKDFTISVKEGIKARHQRQKESAKAGREEWKKFFNKLSNKKKPVNKPNQTEECVVKKCCHPDCPWGTPDRDGMWMWLKGRTDYPCDHMSTTKKSVFMTGLGWVGCCYKSMI